MRSTQLSLPNNVMKLNRILQHLCMMMEAGAAAVAAAEPVVVKAKALMHIDCAEMDAATWAITLAQVADGGYNGVILSLADFPTGLDDHQGHLAVLSQLDLSLAFEICTSGVQREPPQVDADAAALDSVAEHVASFREQLTAALAQRPEIVLVRGGCDFWSAEQKARFYSDVAGVQRDVAGDNGGTTPVVCHKTAAKTALSHPADMQTVLAAFPTLQLELDLGQWCAAMGATATELTTCPRWRSLLLSVESHIRSISASIGSATWRYLPHPTEDEFSGDLQAHKHWWAAVVEAMHRGGVSAPLYVDAGRWHDCQLAMPFSRVVVANTAENNRFLVGCIRKLATAAAAPPPPVPSAHAVAAAAGEGAAASAVIDDPAARVGTPCGETQMAIEVTVDRCDEIQDMITGLVRSAQSKVAAAVSHADLKRRAEWLELGVDASARTEMYTKVSHIPPLPGSTKVGLVDDCGVSIEWLLYSTYDNETLDGIAESRGIELNELMKLNEGRLKGLKPKAKMYEGTLVLLPYTPAPEPKEPSPPVAKKRKKKRAAPRPPKVKPVPPPPKSPAVAKTKKKASYIVENIVATTEAVSPSNEAKSDTVDTEDTEDGEENPAPPPPVEVEDVEEGEASSEDDGQLYLAAKTKDNDTPHILAHLYGCHVRDVIEINKKRFPGLRATSKFRADTDVLLPHDANTAVDEAQ